MVTSRSYIQEEATAQHPDLVSVLQKSIQQTQERPKKKARDEPIKRKTTEEGSMKGFRR
jgi:hypothetical protein